VGWIKMNRDRTLGGGPMTEVTSSRSKQSSSKRDQRRLSVAILLSYGTARVLLAGDAEARPR
jgi:beta-lactamase superfamily II metal-dependent hydrolase